MRKQKTGTIERRGHKIVFSPNEISERVKTLNAISSSSSSSSSSSFQNRMNIVVGNVQNVQVPREKNPWDGWWVEYEEDSQSSSSSSSSLSSSSSGKRNRDQNPNGLLYDSKECTDPRFFYSFNLLSFVSFLFLFVSFLFFSLLFQFNVFSSLLFQDKFVILLEQKN